MNEILMKLIQGQNVTDQEIQTELLEICERVHSSCDSECPVYAVNGSKIPWDKNLQNCICFKDGKAMYDFIKATV